MKRFLLLAMAVLLSVRVTDAQDTASAFRGLAKLRQAVVAQDARGSGAASPSAPESLNTPAKSYVTKLEAPWCSLCKTEPITGWLQDAGWTVKPVNADADDDGSLDPQYGATAVPTFIVMLNGKEAARYTGTNRDEFAAVIKKAKGTEVSTELPAEAAATPYSEIATAYETIKLRPDQDLVDPGCGDARALIVAVEQFGTQHAIGIEIDPARADAARQRVSSAGLSSRIDILTGDSTAMNLKGDVLYGYLYPETWQAMRPGLANFDCVISYMHPVPGLPTEKKGNFYYFHKEKSEPAPAVVAKTTVPEQARTVTQYQWQQVYVAPWARGGRCGNRACVMCYGGYQWKQVPVQVAQVATAQPSSCNMAGCAGRSCSGSGCVQRACGMPAIMPLLARDAIEVLGPTVILIAAMVFCFRKRSS